MFKHDIIPFDGYDPSPNTVHAELRMVELSKEQPNRAAHRYYSPGEINFTKYRNTMDYYRRYGYAKA